MKLAAQISAPRYAEGGKLAFEFRGERETHLVLIREPRDVLLVGTDPEAAARWIAERYGFLLAALP